MKTRGGKASPFHVLEIMQAKGETMIQDAWIDEIMQAMNNMEADTEIRRLLREKLEFAYEAGYSDGAEEENEF